MTSCIAGFAAYVALPIVGIVFFDWDWRSVIILYWLENITVGAQTIIAMIRSPRVQDPGRTTLTFNGSSRPAAKGGLIVFFMFHYGIFTVVHGAFVFLMAFGFFGMMGAFGMPTPSGSIPEIDIGGILLVWGVGSLVQLVAGFFTPRADLPAVGTLFMSPYRRIIVLHLTILGGAWLIRYFEWPPIAAILLVALHFVMDLREALGPRRKVR